MSDQEVGRGHHVTTMHAVRHLFETLPADRLLGHTPQQLFDRLDAAQAKVDGVPLGNSRLAHYISLASGERLSQGSGSTVLPSTWAPEVQKAHALSNPHLSSYENLNAIKSYLVDELTAAKAAHQRGDSNAEFEHLGRVAHSMEDSYSQAHMLRDPTRPSDPEAPIKALLNFDSIPGAASNTHAKAFDKVPTDPSNNDPARPADQAGAEALGRVLSAYVNTIDSADPIATHAAFRDAVQPFFQADHLVTFDNKHDPAYQQQLALHYANEVSLSPVVPDAQERNMSTLPTGTAHPEDSSMGPNTTGCDAVSMQPADAPLESYSTSGADHGTTAAYDGQVAGAPGQPHAGSGNGTSSVAGSLAAQVNGTHDHPESSQGAVAPSDAPGNGH
uniref:hypothetical protein n=1 Tax=uncultured Sphingomonas sp. TaxID=158754 RepID=UPI0035CBF6D8